MGAHRLPRRWTFIVLLLVGTASCEPDDYVDPRPPRSLGAAEPTFAPPPLSTIDVPMTIPVATLLELVEDAVPTRYGDLDVFHAPPDSGRASVAFELERAPFQAQVVDDVARLNATILYTVRVHYALPLLPDVHSSCGEGDNPRPALSVTLESPLTLDRDWTLRTRVRVAELRPASSTDIDRCTVTALGVDITDRILTDARTVLEERLPAIDSLVAAVDTRSSFSGWWETLREPIELSDSLWLAMEPEAVSRGQVRGSVNTITVPLSLRSRPRIVFGNRPPTPRTPLPPLDTATVEPGLNLRVDARAEYETAGRFLEETLGARRIEMEGRSIQVDSLRVYGLGDGRLAMRLDVSGDLRGTLYLTGRPVIDQGTGYVSVPDLELDVATRDAVLSVAASWFTAPLLRDYLRERAVWPTAPAIEWLSMWLDRGLNRNLSDDLRVAGDVERVEIVGATALQDALWVRLAAYGSASMFIEEE